MIYRIELTGPFDFGQMLLRPLSRPSTLFVADSNQKMYSRAIHLRSRPIGIKAIWSGDVTNGHLDIHYPDDLSDAEFSEMKTIVRHMFSVDSDLSGFAAHFSANPVWEDLMRKQFGLRPILDADLFESMVRAIIGQQLNIQFAATLVERLVHLGGKNATLDDMTLPVFPSAETVAGWAYEQLRPLQFSVRKAEYVIDFARAVASGTLSLDGLWGKSDEEIIAELVKLRGIGRWTAECLLLFGMGRANVLPAADIGVQNAVKRLYGFAERPKEPQIRELAKEWGPWQSYATYYLWQSLIEG